MGEDHRQEFHSFHLGALGFLFFANVFDMGGGFTLKYLSYALVLVAIFLQFPANRISIWEIVVFFAVFIIAPLFAVINGLSHGGDLAAGVGQVTPFVPAFLLLFYLRPQSASLAWDMWYLSMRCFAFVIIVLFIIMALMPNAEVVKQTIGVLNENGQGYFGVRSIGAVTIPNVYFKATLFLVPAFAYAILMNQRYSVFLISVALILTFSKAAIAFCIILTALLWLRKIAYGRFSISQVLAVVVVGSALYALSAQVFLGYIDLIFETMFGVSATASVRLGHSLSVFKIFADHPLTLLFGQGVGTSFYSAGTHTIVTDIELDHLDAIRQFGLPWFVVFSALFLVAIRALIGDASKRHTAVGIALLSLFLVAGTNPVLINPLTLLLLVTAWKLSQSAISVNESAAVAPGGEPNAR